MLSEIELAAKSLDIPKYGIYLLNSIAGTFGLGDVVEDYNGKLPRVLETVLNISKLFEVIPLRILEKLDKRFDAYRETSEIEFLDRETSEINLDWILKTLGKIRPNSERYRRLDKFLNKYYYVEA